MLTSLSLLSLEPVNFPWERWDSSCSPYEEYEGFFVGITFPHVAVLRTEGVLLRGFSLGASALLSTATSPARLEGLVHGGRRPGERLGCWAPVGAPAPGMHGEATTRYCLSLGGASLSIAEVASLNRWLEQRLSSGPGGGGSGPRERERWTLGAVSTPVGSPLTLGVGGARHLVELCVDGVSEVVVEGACALVRLGVRPHVNANPVAGQGTLWLRVARCPRLELVLLKNLREEAALQAERDVNSQGLPGFEDEEDIPSSFIYDMLEIEDNPRLQRIVSTCGGPAVPLAVSFWVCRNPALLSISLPTIEVGLRWEARRS